MRKLMSVCVLAVSGVVSALAQSPVHPPIGGGNSYPATGTDFDMSGGITDITEGLVTFLTTNWPAIAVFAALLIGVRVVLRLARKFGMRGI